MTLRLCILGNSHVAALRDAWMQHPGRWPGLTLHFLAAPKDGLLHTTVQDGRLVPTCDSSRTALLHSCGISDITLADHDGFVVAGASICLQSILPLYRDARWHGLPSFARDTDVVASISGAAAQAAMTAILQDRMGSILVSRLRANTDLPIVLTSQPRISAAVLRSPRPEMRLHKVAIDHGDSNALGANFDTAALGLFAGLGCRFLPQPPQTVSHGVLTDLAFMNGALRLTAAMTQPQLKTDISHANALYGALLIDQIVAAF